jgi:DNA-binding MarR family transcriptional regulator
MGVSCCVAFNFRKIARILTKTYDTALEPSGLRSTQFTILVGVAGLQPVSIGDLAKTLLLDPSTLSRGLRLMQRRRLVVVSRRSAMRQRFVTLSARGAQILADSMPLWRQIQEQLLAVIGHEKWKKMHQDLEKLSLETLRDMNLGDYK